MKSGEKGFTVSMRKPSHAGYRTPHTLKYTACDGQSSAARRRHGGNA
jgi:hypothetical protein